jgi:very-short-patch-repair endonuclease
MSKSLLEALLFEHIRLTNLPEPVAQYRAIPGRRFAWDFAWINHRLLVEVNGGTFAPERMGHSTGSGLQRDYLKNNIAVAHGWRVLYFDAPMVRNGEALMTLETVLKGEK